MMNGFWKSNALGLIALIAALVAIGLHFHQKLPRVGYAETGVLMSQFTEAIQAQKEFEENQKTWENNQRTINDSLSASMNRLKQGYEKASKGQKDTLRQNLDKWNSDLNRYNQAVKKMSEDKQKELMGPVLEKMNAYLKQWGKQHGYDLIFGTMTGGNILQANEAYNVTSAFLIDLKALRPFVCRW